MLIKKLSHEAGFTMIELLIALVINALLATALISMFISNLNYYHRNLNANRLNQQLQTALLFMANEIRRAGYSGNGCK